MKRLALSMFAVAAFAVAGCGSDSESPPSTNAATTTADTDEAMKHGDAVMDERVPASGRAARATGTTVKVVASDYGRVIADRKGEAFYLFDREQQGRSECYGACARAWPPVLTRGRPRAGAGARASLLGTTERRNGKLQVTYAGRPLYYYVHDAPGTILCHDVAEFGGLWLVVKPSGRAAA